VNTPRAIVIALDVPAAVTDQQLADRMRRIMLQAMKPDASAELWPDPASLEVTVNGCAAADLLSPAPKDPS